MRHYTTPECLAMLNKALTSKYAADVARCTLIIADKPHLVRCVHFGLQHRHDRLLPIDRSAASMLATSWARVQWFSFMVLRRRSPSSGTAQSPPETSAQAVLAEAGSEPLFHSGKRPLTVDC